MLYSLIADAYLGTLDTQRGLERLRPIPYSVENMRSWLAAIGWHLQRGRGTQIANEGTGETLIAREQLLELLTRIIRARPGDEPRSIAGLFLDYVGRRSGLLLPRGPELYAFLHLSVLYAICSRYIGARLAAL